MKNLHIAENFMSDYRGAILYCLLRSASLYKLAVEIYLTCVVLNSHLFTSHPESNFHSYSWYQYYSCGSIHKS